MKKEKSYKNLIHFLVEEHTNVVYAFMIVGIVIFLLNITAMLNYPIVKYSYIFFNLSIFSSMLLILFGVYSLYEKDKK